MLCTPSKTFHLRQVQTSNSLFVTRPTQEAHGNEIPAPTTRAIAACAATLELHPSVDEPGPLLAQTLPLYDVVEGEVDARGNGRRKETIFPDLPFSDGQCEQAWLSLMAFEMDGSAFRPSARALSHLWKSIIAAAVAEGMKLDEQFLINDLANAVAEEGHPPALATAILRNLSTDEQNANEAWASLDRHKTVKFVGSKLLEARCESKDYLLADFLDAWKDSLPESWREEAQLKAIDGLYEFSSSTPKRVKFTEAAKDSANLDAPVASAKARKWHEKFGKMRKK